jgi:dephospho-CoA kinase
MDKMRVVGLTGGIGCGKSTVAEIFRQLGAYIIDADQLARRVVAPGRPALAEIRKVFGEDMLSPDGTLNRKKLADRVFKDPAARRELERLTHPRIGEEILAELGIATAKECKLAVIDAALLVESASASWLRPLILVVADEETRIERVCGRDSVCAEDVRARIKNQASDEERREKADHVIENNGDLDTLKSQVSRLFRELAGGESGINGESKL